MKEVKKINIKSAYHYFEDMINIDNIEDFHSILLEINKKSHKDINIYYIGYIIIKKFSECNSIDYENIHSVNLLYLIINSATGYFKEKNGEKYLILDLTEKHEEVFSRIISEIKTLNGGKELFYEKNYTRIRINTDDDLPLNKSLKFPTLTMIIRCVLQNGEKLYPQIYLDKCLYELVV